MVLTNKEQFDVKLKALRQHGRDYRQKGGEFISSLLGSNFRMPEIPAAIGLEQLKHLAEWIEVRRKLANLYNILLPQQIIRPFEYSKRRHVYCLYVIRTQKRDELSQFLSKSGIETGIHYPVPIHRQPIFSVDVHLPKTEEICQEVLSLPMYPRLSNKEVEYICQRIGDFQKGTT